MTQSCKTQVRIFDISRPPKHHNLYTSKCCTDNSIIIDPLDIDGTMNQRANPRRFCLFLELTAVFLCSIHHQIVAPSFFCSAFTAPFVDHGLLQPRERRGLDVVGRHALHEKSDGSSSTADLGIQILISDTGGGHRASAYAIRDALDFLYPGRFGCDIVDIYTDYGAVWPYNDYVSIYKYMAANPWMWSLLYEFGKSDFGLWFNQVMLELFCTNSFTSCISRPNPATGRRADMVLSIHPLTQDLPIQIVTRLDRQQGDARRTTPFCTVVTDLGSAHPTWFNPGVDMCFVPSDALYTAARERKLQPKQITQYGLPIRKGFWPSSISHQEAVPSEISKPMLRQNLGLKDAEPVVLVVGGGDGMGGIVDISTQLGFELGRSPTLKSQLVVVCGKNLEAKEKLESISNWGSSVDVKVQGFVTNMDEYMKASDVLVTKAGPGTIAEASICGLPCMMFSYLPGQEEGNIPFVEKSNFGCYNPHPLEIAKIVSQWLSSPDELTAMQQAARAAARPNATLDIAKDIAEMLFDHKSGDKKK